MDTLRTINANPSLTPVVKRQAQRPSVGYWLQRLALHALIWAGGAIMVLPFLWMLATSLKSQGEAMAYPPVWLPQPPLWSNYLDVVQAFPFELFAFNSVKIALLGTLGQLLSTTLAAYAFARMNFPGRNVLFVILLSTLMIPSHVTMIPTFLLFNTLGWVNTHYPLIDRWVQTIGKGVRGAMQVAHRCGFHMRAAPFRQLPLNLPIERNTHVPTNTHACADLALALAALGRPTIVPGLVPQSPSPGPELHSLSLTPNPLWR